MKKIVAAASLALLVFLTGCAGGAETAAVSGGDALDLAIREAADGMNGRLPAGSKLAIISVSSDYLILSDYVISELSANIVNDGVFSLVDRQQLDAIRAEQNFQMSGEVSDESAQSIGRLLGAQAIITGQVARIGGQWRIQVRALEVETGIVRGQFNKNIPSEGIITDLTQGAAQPANAPVFTPAPPPAQQPVTLQAAAAPQAAPPPPRAEQTRVFELGEEGPAGGIVFYDRGEYIDGWRFLEVSPRSWRSLYWGPWGLNVPGTQTGVGSGMRNTEIIAGVMDRRGERGTAAQVIRAYTINGYNDWFLPSKDELELLYIFLRENLMLDSRFGFFGWFFSSSQYSNYEAWGHSFSNGWQGGYRKNISGGLVRAIRAF